MAAAETEQATPRAAEGAVEADRFDEVDTATGLETAARAQEWTDHELIHADRTDQEPGRQAAGGSASIQEACHHVVLASFRATRLARSGKD